MSTTTRKKRPAGVYNINSSAESLKDMLDRHARGLPWKIALCAAVAVFVFWWANTGTLVTVNPFASMAWWLILGVLLAPLAGFVSQTLDAVLAYKPRRQKFSHFLRDVGKGFVKYMGIRMIGALLAALAMIVVWSLYIALFLPRPFWAGLVGLGGLGTVIIIAFGIVFLFGYYQLLVTLVRWPERYLLWLPIWTGCVIVGLLPAIGWSLSSR